MSRPAAPLDILIVEDEALLAMDLAAMIEDTGHRVAADLSSLPEIVALHDGLSPAIAFVDIQLAHGSCGLDVARFIRRRWPATLIVFVTANPLKIPADFAGAHGVIAKPFSRPGLLSAMAYLAECVVDPPPLVPPPTSFVASAALAATWPHPR